MSESAGVTDRLNSWKEIAVYVGRDVRTVIRWEQKGGLPVYRVPVGQRQAVYAYRHEIDEWMSGSRQGNFDFAGALQVAAARADRAHTIAGTAVAPSVSDADQKHGRLRLWIPARFVICFGAVVLGPVIVCLVRWQTSPQAIEFTGVMQITTDGTTKEALVTDGRNIVFNEERNGRIVLATVSSEGGAIRVIPSSFVKARPEAISPDGSRLLVLAWEGQETERALWILRVVDGKSTRVGQVLCHNANWSPDGRKIAFAYGNAIYLTDDQGTSPKELQAFTDTPETLEWWPDGKRIRFQLRDLATGHSSFWEIFLSDADEATVSSLIPLHIAFNGCCNSSTIIDPAGRSFVVGGDVEGNGIHMIEKVHRLWSSQFTSTQARQVITNPDQLVLNPRSKQMFATGVSESSSTQLPDNHWDEAYLYDRKSLEFRPFLPGISVDDIDFSRDAKWITWLRADNQTLWVSRPDGSEARQIDFSATGIELPRWSPDGRQIAFMARLPGKTWRIFVTSVDKDKPREASVGTDSQGAPTWSPDGKWLVYGNVWCEQARSCAIRKIDLSTGRVSTLPGSEGLETARWSPNGRYVAALWPDRHSIEIFDVKKEEWRTLANCATGNDLGWSSDSRYVYASNPNGDRPNIIQVALADGSVRSSVDLSTFKSMTGRIDTWFGLTPDNSIIFVRWQQPDEIYALNFVEK